MTGRELTEALNRGMLAAEQRVAALEERWSAALRDAGKLAADDFGALTAAADWQPPPEGLVLTAAALARIERRLNEQLAPIWESILIDVARAPLARIGIDWTVSHPAARALLDTAATRTGERLNAAAQLEIRKAIEDAYAQGLAVRDTADLIRTSVSQAAPWQAEMLARSDLNSLANGSSLAAAKEVGVEFKTWDCVVGETCVSGLGITHAARRLHTGEFVELATAAGRILTVTGEHPILTRRGWVRAKFVEEGDDLVGYRGEVERPTPPSRMVPNVDHMPSQIAKTFAALAEVRPIVRLVGVDVDLDGEGGGREVDVVAVDRELAARIEPSLFEREREFLLELTDVRLAALFADRPPEESGLAHGSANIGLAGGHDPLLDDLLSLPRSTQTTGFRARAHGRTALLENPADDFGGALPLGGDSAEGETCRVLFDYDRCVAVDVYTASRHVFDYTTTGGWIIANSLVVHNSTLDAVTRPTHAAVHGQTVPIGGVFDVGGEIAEYPGDPNLSDAEAANCRCTLVYGSTLEEASGLLADGGAIMGGMKTGADREQEGKLAGMSLVASPKPIGFTTTATIEGRISDDNSLTPRVILPMALSWPEMPLPFMAQTVTAEGHDGAEVAGRVDEFARKKGTGRMQNITGAGELTTPFGINEIAPMIEDQTMRFVSVDLGAGEWALVYRDSFKPVPEEDLSVDDLMAGKYAMGMTTGKIKALTLVPTQAIEGATIALTASADGGWTVTFPAEWLLAETEALVAAAAPMTPPADWFTVAEPPGKMPLTVGKDGRVFGHLATWDSCHVSFLGVNQCVPPPRSPTNYAYFHVCELDTAGGDVVTVGKLMFSPTDGGHADRSLTARKASAYYDRTGMAAAYLRVVDGNHGIWACGTINPDLSDEQRTEMRRQLRLHPPSGDWRPINGQYELICGLAVAVPGFPVPRAVLTVTASADGAALDGHDAIIASSGFFEPDEAAVAALDADGLLDGEAEAERRMRVLAARAEGLDALAELVS